MKSYSLESNETVKSCGGDGGTNASPSKDVADLTDLKEFITLTFSRSGIPDRIPTLVQQMAADAEAFISLIAGGLRVRKDVVLSPRNPNTTTRRVNLGTHDMPNWTAPVY